MLAHKGIIDKSIHVCPTGFRLSSTMDISYHAKRECVGCINSVRHVFKGILLDNLCMFPTALRIRYLAH